MKEDYKRPIFVEAGRWCKHNVCFSPAIIAAYPQLGVRELALLDYIASWCEREKACQSEYVDLPLSYGEVGAMFNCSKKTAATIGKRIITKLLKVGLIVAVNSGQRRGRAKSIYEPNVTKIRQAINDYLNNNECDKKP